MYPKFIGVFAWKKPDGANAWTFFSFFFLVEKLALRNISLYRNSPDRLDGWIQLQKLEGGIKSWIKDNQVAKPLGNKSLCQFSLNRADWCFGWNLHMDELPLWILQRKLYLWGDFEQLTIVATLDIFFKNSDYGLGEVPC